ncbi:hypothetical protein BCR44DRAFT_1434375 [Catenaria anguillulae PL171]|uniref:Uncharacterized protein n=1 Tax=Catenaria anguillulae PL171 TaxID=765915 RepID=A0A1Y2HP86_9FUNG|nr:hypothetical protein BCR44DRAFT_1434375 [Catenaria anguillulae PL171]
MAYNRVDVWNGWFKRLRFLNQRSMPLLKTLCLLGWKTGRGTHWIGSRKRTSSPFATRRCPMPLW